MADAGAAPGCDLPGPGTEPRRRHCAPPSGPRVALANPLDYHTYIWGDDDALTRAFTAMMDPGLALACVVLDFPRADRCDAAGWAPALAGRGGRARRPPARRWPSSRPLPESLPETDGRSDHRRRHGAAVRHRRCARGDRGGREDRTPQPVDHLPILASGPLAADADPQRGRGQGGACGTWARRAAGRGASASVQGAVDAAACSASRSC